MSIELFIYLANVLDKVSVVFFTFGVLLIAAVVVGVFARGMEYMDENSKKPWQPYCTTLVWLSFVSFIVSALLPSERTMYMMAGASLAKEAVNSATGQKVQAVVNAKLDEMLSDLTKKGK
jgi:hypothetical protein